MIQIDIPMPENCAECPCYGLDEFERSRCNITGHEFPHNIFDGRADDCPLKEQEEKAGKWIPVTNGRGGMECSICHDYAPSYQSCAEYLSKYCPNCGAKMEGK